MKVSVHAADEGGCGYYRLRWPVEELQRQGHDVVLNSEIKGKFMDWPDGRTQVLSTTVPDGADAIVLQRPTHLNVARLIPSLKEHGVAVVVEVDDDFLHIPAQNIAFKSTHPKYNPRSNWKVLGEAIAQADQVTVSTPRLAKIYGGSARAVVIPNCVPGWYLKYNPPFQERYGVGWSGSIRTHRGDLEMTRGVLMRTAEPFRVIGTGSGVAKALGLNYEPESTGWLELTSGKYQQAVSTLKVGVVPLADSAFNHAKSWLKGLEYAAFGVPFVASPTEEYVRLSQLGAGLIAYTKREWRKHVERLLTDADFWHEMSESGRKVAEEYTYENQAWRWMEAWEEARINAALRIAS